MSIQSEQNVQIPPKLDVVTTLCKNCIFSVKDHISNAQISCSRGRLDKYKRLGVEIIPIHHDDGDYFLINGRTCIFCRDEEWKNTYSDDIEFQLRKETNISYDAIIVSNEDYKSIIRTVHSLEAQSFLPKRVTIILSNNEDEIAKSLMDYFLEKAKFAWRLHHLLEFSNSDVSLFKAIDHIVENQKSSFYTLANAGYKYQNIFKRLNEKIVDEMCQIPCILPDKEQNGLICSVFLHKTLFGNRIDALVNKIENLKWELTTINKFQV